MQTPSDIDWARLVEQRDFLVRFARRRLRDPAQAEDLVHDVFEAVMSGRAQFGGRCALRSWLVAVLRHKIVDLVRDTCSLVSIEADEDEDGDLHTIECPQPRPEQHAEQRQRLRRALAGIAALPDALRQVVELRVLDDLSTEQVCSALAISADNLFVRLHRARRQLSAA